jgi:hypothetical protein
VANSLVAHNPRICWRRAAGQSLLARRSLRQTDCGQGDRRSPTFTAGWRLATCPASRLGTPRIAPHVPLPAGIGPTTHAAGRYALQAAYESTAVVDTRNEAAVARMEPSNIATEEVEIGLASQHHSCHMQGLWRIAQIPEGRPLQPTTTTRSRDVERQGDRTHLPTGGRLSPIHR